MADLETFVVSTKWVKVPFWLVNGRAHDRVEQKWVSLSDLEYAGGSGLKEAPAQLGCVAMEIHTIQILDL